MGTMRLVAVLLNAAAATAADPDDYSPLLPSPAHSTNGSTTLLVSDSMNCTWDPSTGSATGVLAGAVARAKATIFAWGPSNLAPAGAPILTALHIVVRDPDDSAASLQLGMDESYTLDVATSGTPAAVLRANSTWGALRGLETLTQLVDFAHGRYQLRFAPWHIEDRPAFPHRGVLIDTARHFLPVPTLLRQIDALAMNKMNTLHWHAVDSQSFPLAMEAFPELAKQGAFGLEGIYSVADQRAVVAYARARGVRVVLETDLPGHATSWSLALPDIFVTCPSKNSNRGLWGGVSRVIDPTLNATWEFLDRFIGELAGRFPERVLHLGGDEVSVGCFNASKSVRRWVAAQGPGTTLQDVYVMFETRIHALAAKHGKRVQTWHDAFAAMSAAGQKPPADAIAQVWMGTCSSQNTCFRFCLRKSLFEVRFVRSSRYYLM